MVEDRFNYLTATVEVNSDAPAEWAKTEDLPFWEAPNSDEVWSGRLARVLYHETLHFWQLLLSPYLANLWGSEWKRVQHFADTGEIAPRASEYLNFDRSTGEMYSPFSARELMECWARYWDVHTRSPLRIIKEENISVKDPEKLVHRSGGQEYYSGIAFDTVMQLGEDCQVYARPYRWLLDDLGGNSLLAALIFPIIVQAAFATPKPVENFVIMSHVAYTSEDMQPFLAENQGSINLAWLRAYPFLVRDFIRSYFESNKIHVFDAGLDVMRDGALATHPIYRDWPQRYSMTGYIQMFRPISSSADFYSELYNHELVSLVRTWPHAPLALPGQPFYRRALGFLVPPPRICFRNLTVAKRRPAFEKLRRLSDSTAAASRDDYTVEFQALDKLVTRFRNAEKAVELGLPPDAFET